MSFGGKLSHPAKCFCHCFGSHDRFLACHYFCDRLRAVKPYVTWLVSNHDRRIMSENPGSNEISSNKGSRSRGIYFPILFYIHFGTLITGRLMEDGRLIGGHLMEVELYTEWDDNHVCIDNKSVKGLRWNPTWWVLSLKKSPANWKIIDNKALLNRDILWQRFPRDKWPNAVLR